MVSPPRSKTVDASTPFFSGLTCGDKTLGLAVAIFLCLIAFNAFITYKYFPHAESSSTYLQIARNLVSGSGYTLNGAVTAARPPAYPVFLAAMISLTPGQNVAVGVILGQVLLTVACFAALIYLARKLWPNPMTTALAALLFALNGSAVREFIGVRETALYSLSVLAFAIAWTCWKDTLGKAVVLGAISGMALLIRPSGILFIPVALILIAGFWERKSAGAKGTAMAAFTAAFALTVLPWQLHMHHQFGRFELTGSTTGGLNLAKGNLPAFGDLYIAVDVDSGDGYINDMLAANGISGTDELAASDFLRARALQAMAGSPIDTLRRFAQKTLLYFSPSDVYYGDGKVEQGPDGVLKLSSFSPRNSMQDILYHTVKVFLVPFGLVGLGVMLATRGRMRRWAAFAVLLALGSAVLHGLTFPEFRFRYAIEPLFSLAAAGLISGYFERRAGGSGPVESS